MRISPLRATRFQRSLAALFLLSFGGVTATHSQTAVWTQLPNTPGPNNVRHDDIYFADPTNGWSSQNNYIYRTTNGGGTWTTNLFLSGTHFRSVAFATPMIG